MLRPSALRAPPSATRRSPPTPAAANSCCWSRAGCRPPASKPEPEPRVYRRRGQTDGPKVGQDYVPTNRRITAWAAMAAERSALGHSLADIALDLCVTEDTAAQLLAMAQQGRAA